MAKVANNGISPFSQCRSKHDNGWKDESNMAEEMNESVNNNFP